MCSNHSMHCHPVKGGAMSYAKTGKSGREPEAHRRYQGMGEGHADQSTPSHLPQEGLSHGSDPQCIRAASASSVQRGCKHLPPGSL